VLVQDPVASVVVASSMDELRDQVAELHLPVAPSRKPPVAVAHELLAEVQLENKLVVPEAVLADA
jgi:hypothetical protein